MQCQLLLIQSDDKIQNCVDDKSGLDASCVGQGDKGNFELNGMQLRPRSFRVFLAAVSLFSLLSVICLITGVYLYQKSSIIEVCAENDGLNRDQRILLNVLSRVKSDYFKLYPNEVFADPDLEQTSIINNFSPYDPNWKTLKARTDHALKLRQQLEDSKIDTSQLKPREKKAYAQMQHYLESIFGNPYDENYYAGDWMLGPNYFCWQHICSVTSTLAYHYNVNGGFMPKTFSDVEKIISTIKRVKTTFETYKNNMILGVKTGMVRSVEDCSAGYNKFAINFPAVLEDGARGIIRESFATDLLQPLYYAYLDDASKTKFFQKYKKLMHEKVSEILVEYVGVSVNDFMLYLKNNHSRHCVPSNVASGLANLPLKRVWLDGKETQIKTTQRLPTGEKLNGAKSYEMILPYFTTTKLYNATSINALGEMQKDKLYERAKDIAIKITGKPVNTAINEFKADLNHPRQFFNTTPIPDNENGEIGGSRCRNMEEAKKNCPVRYQAMQDWFRYAEEIISKLDALTVNMFYMAGERKTTPVCPVKMVAKFNPSSGSQSYSGGGSNCARASYYKLPFFLKLPGPRYNAFSVAGHETRPGHHTQVQGFNEHFSSSGRNDVIDWLNTVTYYTAFTEGWALYAENPLLSTETLLYDGEPLQEYGMLKWQIWRALRLIIDTGLHSRGMTKDEALQLFEMFAWDTTDKSYKDTIRYMSDPGQATAYMIGQLAIWEMRNETELMLAKNNITFDEKEFHYQILSQGSSPLQYLQSYIKDYIQCKIDATSRGDCQEILHPNKSKTEVKKFPTIGSKDRWNYISKMKNIIGREYFD